jgi:hypothetical protein
MRANEHPGVEQLLDYLDGRLSAPEAAVIQAHLESGCGQCAAERTRWERTLASLRSTEQDTPPEWVLRRAFAAFANFVPQTSGWQRFLASLVFDSRVQAAPAGARDTGGASFQLLYQSNPPGTPEGVEVDLLCERETVGWTITGQAVGGGFSRALCSRAGEVLEAPIEPGGEFHFRQVPVGIYELSLLGEGVEILLGDVQLGDSRSTNENADLR